MYVRSQLEGVDFGTGIDRPVGGGFQWRPWPLPRYETMFDV